jgi:hypothetical protein
MVISADECSQFVHRSEPTGGQHGCSDPDRKRFPHRRSQASHRDGEPIPTDEINATLEQISELVNSLLDRTGIGDVTLSVPRATSERELFTDDLMATAIGLAFTQNLIERTRFRRMTQ